MTTDVIELRGGKYVVLSEAGAVLGSFDTEAEARGRLRQIEAAKAAKAAKDSKNNEGPPRETEIIGTGDGAAPTHRVETGVRRYDRGTLRRKPRYDSTTGFMKADASITRAPAVFEYKREDGTVQHEYRPAEHVFSADNIERMRNAPITMDHPPVRVTSRNIKRYSIGHADGSFDRVDDHGHVGIVIQDDDAIASMRGGTSDTSCGYDCDLLFRPGVHVDADGRRFPYDAIQTNHRNNHIAICERGRAGSTRVCMDRTDAVQVTTEDNMADEKKTEHRREDFFFQTGTENKARVTIDGVDIELPTEQARLVADSQAKAANALAAEKAKADGLEAARDTAITERDDLKTKLTASTSDDEMQTRFDVRMALIEKAGTILSPEGMEAAKTADEKTIKLACIKAANPTIDMAEKSDAYIEAAFDMIKPKKANAVNHAARKLLGAKSTEKDERSDHRKRIDAAIEATDSRHKQAIPGGWTTSGPTPGGEELHG